MHRKDSEVIKECLKTYLKVQTCPLQLRILVVINHT